MLTRSPSGSVPTAAGSLVAEWAALVLSSAEQFAAGVSALRENATGRLVVSASLTIAEYLLPGWLGALCRRQPGVAVELEVVNSATVIDRVSQGSAQIGFIESPGTTGGLNARDVGSDELVVVVPPGHPWTRRRRPLLAHDLHTTALVLRESGSGTRDAFTAALAANGLGAPAAALELGSTAAVKAAVEAGAGPAVLSRLAVGADLIAGRLEIVPVEGMDLRRRLRAVWRQGQPLEPAAAALLTRASTPHPALP